MKIHFVKAGTFEMRTVCGLPTRHYFQPGPMLTDIRKQVTCKRCKHDPRKKHG